MKIAVISITENGAAISSEIKKHLVSIHKIVHYAFGKYPAKDAVLFSSLSELTSQIFNKYDGLIFIASCGIAVRVTAPYICSKVADPAVIAIDNQGKYAVSLLSGHLGGANRLAREAAQCIGALPVITTATDSSEKFSPDCFAKSNNLYISNMEMAKETAACIVNGQKLGIVCRYPHSDLPDELSEDLNLKTGICITDNINEQPYENTLCLLPENIIIGIGCRKNVSFDILESFILSCLNDNNIPLYRVKELATVDLKKEEAAINRFSRKHGIPLKFYTPKQLMKVPGSFSSSDFVKSVTNADNICERSAAASRGKLIVSKICGKGVTFAAAEQRVFIDFERG